MKDPQLMALRCADGRGTHIKSHRDEEGASEEIGANRETQIEHSKGIKKCSSKKVMRPTVQLKCHYTNAHSRGNKQELKATMKLESCDLVAITESWWYGSHDCSAALHGYRLFRRDGQGRKGGGVALYIKRAVECKVLSLKNSHKLIESLWVRNRDQGNKGNLVTGSITGRPINSRLLTPATGGITLAGSYPARRLQPP